MKKSYFMGSGNSIINEINFFLPQRITIQKKKIIL